ncbi:hypothetical protein EC991_010218 [Linnemannia zychae]|nr:hypothetical protein EC991_010218 [Linnemannia zychae]
MQFSTLIAVTIAASMALLSETASALCNQGQKCPAVIDPICAQDSKGVQHSFINKCAFGLSNCGSVKEWTIVHPGYCAQDLQRRALAFDPSDLPKPGCEGNCPSVITPVCAEDKTGKQTTFKNSCYLTIAKCQYPAQGWVQISSRTCIGDLD